MSLFENIQTLCREKHLTISEVERGADLKKSTITKWDTTAPSIYKVRSVADYFGISIDELIGRSAPALSAADRQILNLFHELNEDGQSAALAMLQGLSRQPAYIKNHPAEEMALEELRQ